VFARDRLQRLASRAESAGKSDFRLRRERAGQAFPENRLIV
jgi:hypothetical protein